MMKTIFFAAFLLCFGVASGNCDKRAPIKIGWIGAMSGPVAKYGAFQAAQLAMEDINASGGMNGRRLEIIFQDGKCNSKEAVLAANHLINVEKVKFIVGGHCSPESLPISNIAQRSGVVMMAAITSTPKLTNAGDYIFRVTAPNIEGAKKLLTLAQQRGQKNIAIVYEETEYAQGLADYFNEHAQSYGLKVSSFDGYAPSEHDFRAIISKLRAAKPSAIYLSPQSPDSVVQLLKSLKEQHFTPLILGNEIAGNAFNSVDAAQKNLFEGLIFAEPHFENNSERVKDFEARYAKNFATNGLPYGFYTCEAYDAVSVVANAIVECGEDPAKVKDCLSTAKGFAGVSGVVKFDQNGDGIRDYKVKLIGKTEIKELE